jgi:hypothetical protein
MGKTAVVTGDDCDMAYAILRALGNGEEPYALNVYPAARVVAEVREKLRVKSCVDVSEAEVARRQVLLEGFLAVSKEWAQLRAEKRV